MHRSVVLGLALWATVLATGCGARRPPEDPQSVLRAYAQALSESRADDAYRLLSEDARRSISLAAFRRLIQDDPEGVREIGRSLARPAAPASITATVVSPSGQELHLVLENGAWRVDGSAIDLYAQDTPRHAVAGFVRAIEQKRYDIVLRYVPDAHRDGLDAAKLRVAWEGREKGEVEQVVAALKRTLPGAVIEETGERASMSYGSATLLLVREHGLWKIENFD